MVENSNNYHIILKVKNVLDRELRTVTKDSKINKKLDNIIEELTSYIDKAPPDNMTAEENIKYLLRYMKYPQHIFEKILPKALYKYSKYTDKHKYLIAVELNIQVYHIHQDALRKSRSNLTNAQRAAINTSRRQLIRLYFKSKASEGGLGYILPKI